MNDIDSILKAALSPENTPSEKLNEKIQRKVMESGKMRKIKKNLITAAVIVLILIILPTAVYAAYKYLSPKEAANNMQDKKLGEAFDKEGTKLLQTITDGSYKVTYLGHVTGESISERTGSAWELNPDRLYVAAAVEKADGTVMSDTDSLFISPLIQGLKPWQFNITTMNGSYMEKIIDGVLYRIIECDNIEIFADKKLYLAVSDTAFYSTDAFQYDDKTGFISADAEYKGTNILFDLELDTAMADYSKAKAYIQQLEKEWNEDLSTEEMENSKENNTAKDDITAENPRIQQEIFKDKENGLTFRIKDNDSSRWWAYEYASETIFRYHFEVEGEGIESLTYTLNKGEFGAYTENKQDERKSYGKKYSLSYENQDKIDYLYAILFKANYSEYGYNNEDLLNLGIKDIDARGDIYYDVLNQEINGTKIDLEIKRKDGSVVNKTLALHNVLDNTTGVFWIAVNLE